MEEKQKYLSCQHKKGDSCPVQLWKWRLGKSWKWRQGRREGEEQKWRRHRRRREAEMGKLQSSGHRQFTNEIGRKIQYTNQVRSTIPQLIIRLMENRIMKGYSCSRGKNKTHTLQW
jgi:hypothetical protein